MAVPMNPRGSLQQTGHCTLGVAAEALSDGLQQLGIFWPGAPKASPFINALCKPFPNAPVGQFALGLPWFTT